MQHENLVRDRAGRLWSIDNAWLDVGPLAHDLARTWYRWPLAREERARFLAGYATLRSPADWLDALPFWLGTAIAEAASPVRDIGDGWFDFGSRATPSGLQVQRLLLGRGHGIAAWPADTEHPSRVVLESTVRHAASVADTIGVPAARTKTRLFMLVSGAAWLVGVLIAFRINAIQANQGNGEEFIFIIAAVVGGTLLTGGYGTALGGAIGALVMSMAVLGIPSSRWESDWRYLFQGVILLTAVIANRFIRDKAEGMRR